MAGNAFWRSRKICLSARLRFSPESSGARVGIEPAPSVEAAQVTVSTFREKRQNPQKRARRLRGGYAEYRWFFEKVLRINRRTNHGQRGPFLQRNPVRLFPGDATLIREPTGGHFRAVFSGDYKKAGNTASGPTAS
jgi:hypothetical protein